MVRQQEKYQISVPVQERNNSLLILWSVVDLLEGETMDERTDLESIIFGHFLLLSHMTKVKADPSDHY